MTNKELGKSFFKDVLGKGDWDNASEIVASDVVMHHPSSPEPIKGYEAVKGFLSAFRAGFPDLSMTVHDVIVEDNKVAVRWEAKGTHEADLFGIPPTGKRMDAKGISILHIVDGKISEDWVSEDTMGVMQQLGVIPPMG